MVWDRAVILERLLTRVGYLRLETWTRVRLQVTNFTTWDSTWPTTGKTWTWLGLEYQRLETWLGLESPNLKKDLTICPNSQMKNFIHIQCYHTKLVMQYARPQHNYITKQLSVYMCDKSKQRQENGFTSSARFHSSSTTGRLQSFRNDSFGAWTCDVRLETWLESIALDLRLDLDLPAYTWDLTWDLTDLTAFTWDLTWDLTAKTWDSTWTWKTVTWSLFCYSEQKSILGPVSTLFLWEVTAF